MSQVSIEQAMEWAKQQIAARNFAGAERACREVLAVNPRHAEAMHVLGALAMNVGKLAIAAELFRRALEIEPSSADIHYNLGVALIRMGRTPEAAAAFGRAAELQPMHLAARGNLAAALVSMQRFEEGIELCRSTIALAPDHPDAWNNLGVALQKVGRIDESIVAFERSVAVRPDSVETLSNLGNNLAKVGRFEEAIPIQQRAVALRPDSAELLNDLGCALYDSGRYEEAIDAFERAMTIKPAYMQACTLAIALHRAGRLDEAIAKARDAVNRWPNEDLPKFNLGQMLLLNGEFEEGWKLNESRLGVAVLKLPQPVVGKPVWSGADLNGQRIVLYGEQGLGDFVQFIRYIPMVKARGGTIILGCAPEMIRVARQIEGVERLVTSAREPVQFDTHAPLLSLPYIFGTNLSNIPGGVPYLKADPELVQTWRARLPEDPKLFKVGLCWAGRPTHADDRNRSTTLATLAPLMSVEGAWFCSLQKGDAANQAKPPPPGMQVAEFSEDVTDFADTAAIIENLDLVITVDTVVAHLAGAMGKPTWVLLPRVPDWRWLLDRSDSPWYPTLRLFRQEKGKDWSVPIAQAVEALRDAVAGKRR